MNNFIRLGIDCATMLEDVEDTKAWLQEEERLERRITLIELWEDGKSEELKEKAGAYYDDFQEMMEILEGEYSKDEINDAVMKSELESEGFETVIALRIVEALDTAEARGDLTIVKRKTTPEQQGRLAETSVKYHLGKIGTEELDEILDDMEMGGSAGDLFVRTNRFMKASIENALKKQGGIASIRESVSSRSGYDEKRVEKFMQPIERNSRELQADLTQAKVSEMEEKLEEIDTKIDQILRMLAGK